MLSWEGVHLFIFDRSLCSRKVVLALQLKRIHFTVHRLDPAKREARTAYFLGINPRGLVPAMVHDGCVIIESNDILMHIEKVFPDSAPVLLPRGAGDQSARVQELLEVHDQYHMSIRTVSFRAWRDAATLLAMGQLHIRAMDAEEAADGELKVTDVAGSGGQGRAEQRAFYAALVANKGIPDEQLQQHVELLRTELTAFDQLYAATSLLVLGAGLSAADLAVFVDVERLLDTQQASGSALDIAAEFPHLHAAHLRLAAQIASPAAKPTPPFVTAYTADLSICSQICRLAIVEHGLKCRNVHVDIECRMDNYDPWFIRMQPTMTVPCMKYDGAVVGDSRDILYFLAERHPGLYPAEHRSAIDAYVAGFYDRFQPIAAFTFGHLVQRDSPGVVDFIRRGKLDLTRAKLTKYAPLALMFACGVSLSSNLLA